MTKALVTLMAIAFASIALGLQFGATEFQLGSLFQCAFVNQPCDSVNNWLIFSEVRLPRVLTAFLVGAGLALSGSLLQRVSRNPLADPYLFGIVAGAGLGAVIGQQLMTWLGLSLAIPVLAFSGAMLVTLVVFLLMSWQGWQHIERMLLAGVAMSFFCTALTSFILYLQSPHAANRVLFWLMGSLAVTDWTAVYTLAPVLLFTIVFALGAARLLDAIQLNDDAIHALGIRLTRLRLLIMIAVALLTGVIVAFCGGIGFVGLMMPHLVRILVGKSSQTQIIGNVLIGGSFLVLVDMLARTALPYQEIPIGIITAAIGSLFFVFLMRVKS